MKDYNIELVKIDQNPGSLHPSYSEPCVLCVNVERGAAVLTYHVLVGPFVVIVKVLNIDEDLNNSSEITTLGKGGFGSIIA
jgi:dUTPase